MKKILTGLCMCWGNFCFIPGPKKWDEEARPYMLAWLPTVGVIMGIIWAACIVGLNYIVFPMAVGAVATWIPFVLSGFIHVDGFMDVSDATMSRGTLEKKRTILKDSRCGTFAIVSFIFVVLVEFGVMSTAAFYMETLDQLVRVVMIVALPRAVSSFLMMTLKPMDTSQYIEMKRDNKAEIFLLAQLAFWMVIALIIGRECFTGVLLTEVLAIGGTVVSIFFARHELKGMNGDVAGYGIIWGELFGIISLALYMG